MVIELHSVRKSYETAGESVVGLPAVHLTVREGEFVGVRGPSGCGKTTLLLIAGGMIRPSAGRVNVAGTDPYGLSGRKRAAWRARTIGFVFQVFHLLPYANVLENTLLPTIAGGGVSRDAALSLLDRLGLSHRLGHKPAELSIGERQRVAVARALLKSPPVVLADEPTGNLDPANARAVMDHLAEYNRRGATVLLVTHESAALEYADRVVDLKSAVAGVEAK